MPQIKVDRKDNFLQYVDIFVYIKHRIKGTTLDSYEPVLTCAKRGYF